MDLIAGLPYENYESFGHSFDEVYGMQPEQLQLGFLKVLKGSKMYEKAKEYGLLYMDDAPYEVLRTKELDYADVLRLKQIEEMVEIYYNSNQFVKTLRALVKEFERPFQMFEALADFYEKKGYFIQTPARSYRYQVLRTFIMELVPEKEAFYTELLTDDLYLRENAKTRPDFAADLSVYKDICRLFYQDEMEKHSVLMGYDEYDARQMARMTHIEVFHYGEDTSTKLAEPRFVLYDYLHRNPLTYEAKTYSFVAKNGTLCRKEK